jgi:Haemolymph juvenile hormone binding protein (JHBP)
MNKFPIGISELQIPPIEPMKIKSVVVKTAGGTSSFNLESSFKDARIHGLSTSTVLRTAVKFKKFQMKSDAYTKRMDFEGETSNFVSLFECCK